MNAYRRKSNIVKRAIANDLLNELFNKHYKEIAYLEKIDSDAFNDTYLHLTNSLDNSISFVEQFRHQFNILRYAYNLDTQSEKAHILFTDAIFEKAQTTD